MLAVLTEWPEFMAIDPFIVARRLKNTIVIDGRNVLNREQWSSVGFVYKGVGR